MKKQYHLLELHFGQLANVDFSRISLVHGIISQHYFSIHVSNETFAGTNELSAHISTHRADFTSTLQAFEFRHLS